MKRRKQNPLYHRFLLLVHTAKGIALLYLLLAAAWILITDWLLFQFVTDIHQLTRLQIYKGWFFVSATGFLLYLLVQSSLKQTHESRIKLAEHRDELNLIVENLPGMVYRARAEEGLSILYTTKGASRLTGYSVEKLVDQFTDFLDLVDEEDRAEVMAAIAQARKAGGTFHLIHRIKGPKGKRHWVMHDGRIIRGGASGADRVEGILTDITIETETLKESEERLRTIIEHSKDGIFIFQNNRFILVNPKFIEIYGYSLEEIYGVNFDFRRLIVPEEREIVDQLEKELASSESPARTVSLNCIRKDGSHFINESSITMIDWDGHPAILGIMRDVTDQRRIEKNISQSQKLESVGRLAGGIAHDFNNLLTSIAGNAELAEFNYENGKELREELREIRKIATIAATLTRRLLTFSRQRPSESKPVDLNALIEDILILIQRLLGPNITLEIDLGSNLGHVLTDGAQMEQVLINLAVNAKDAMLGKGGTLRIITDEVTLPQEGSIPTPPDLASGRYVRLRVEDTGEGMTADIKQRIFEPFFTTKENGKGTGFGLATVYGIVTQTKGAIDVESTPGEGTSFAIYLPRLEPVPREKGVSEEMTQATAQEVSILLVEDDASVRNMLVKSMRLYGFNVQAASGGEAALFVIEQMVDPPDVVITDLMMSGMNGVETARKVLELYPETRIILMSGYTSDEVDQELLADHRVEFVTKPIGPKQLAQHVRELFASV